MTEYPAVHIDAPLANLPIGGWPCRWCDQYYLCARAYKWACAPLHEHEACPLEEFDLPKVHVEVEW